jgi:hypothetical protein
MRLVSLSVLAMAAVGQAASAQPAIVHFTIDAQQNVQPISRLIYGANRFALVRPPLDHPPAPYAWLFAFAFASQDTHTFSV